MPVFFRKHDKEICLLDAGETVQQLSTHTALADYLSWVPSNNTVWLTPPLTPVPGDLLLHSMGTCTQACIPTEIYTDTIP